jgi:hypothetical protein
LENDIAKVSCSNYKVGSVKFIVDYENTFTRFVILWQKYWNDDDVKKHCLIQNGQNIELIDSVVVNNKSNLETCKFLWSHPVRYDQQNKDKATRQI